MGRKFQKPPHPNTGRTDPFTDADGKNPFSGDNAEIGEKDVFAAAVVDPVRDYEAADFDATVAHRGSLIFWLGIIGFVMSLVGVVGVAGVTADDFGLQGSTSTATLAPTAIFCLVPAAAAWLLGRQDRQAIQAGAMDPAGRTATTRGTILGAIGTVIGVLASVTYFCLTVLFSWQ